MLPPIKRPPAPTKVQWRLIIRLCLALLCAGAFMAIYFGVVALSEYLRVYIPILEIYCLLAAACAVSICVLCRGLGNGIFEHPEDYFGTDWTEEKKQKFLAGLPRRKTAKKILSVILFSLCLSIAADFVMLFFFDR